jgi:hypothetical protein
MGAVEPKLFAGEQFRGRARVYDRQNETDLKAMCLFKGARDVCPQKLGTHSARCSSRRGASKASCSAQRLDQSFAACADRKNGYSSALKHGRHTGGANANRREIAALLRAAALLAREIP